MIWDSPDWQYTMKGLSICEYAALQFRDGRYDGVHIRCFNRADADWFKNTMAELYPDVPMTTSWLEWGAER